MPKELTPYQLAEQKIAQALKSGATNLDLGNMKLTELPESISHLTRLNFLNLSYNRLTILPESLGQLTQLTVLNISNNQLTDLPESLGRLNLKSLTLGTLNAKGNVFKKLPSCIRSLKYLSHIQFSSCGLTSLPEWIGELSNLQHVWGGNNQISELPNSIIQLSQLRELILNSNLIRQLPKAFGKISSLQTIEFNNNKITNLPSSFARLENLENLRIENNPLNPALQSAYNACKKNSGYEGYEPLWAYLRSLEQNAEPLYEAKLVLVGEGKVGKTTLLKALRIESKAEDWFNLGKATLLKAVKGTEDEAPRKNETTTHGVEIDIHGLCLPHPENNGVEIQLNAWDFGGQEVYRVTHQFFFSRRSLYLLVWEPRRGVQQGQVEDWLNMIRLRVGDEALVIIVSTHCKTGERIARIDKDVLKHQYGDMIVGFHEVDSLVPEPATGEMTGIAELKKIIASEAAKLEQMGMLFNNNWKAARDELLALPEPRISFRAFSRICAARGLSGIDTDTLAHLMHDLGYIVHYSDDEKLRDDVVLKPEWLTKAIGFVLENRATAEREGILPDGELYKVWHDHAFPNEPRYTPDLYPFFLRLMEKYDVCYRLPDDRKASLVAQHVPQIRPELPWLPEQEPPTDQRRIAMVCAMEEDPPGLVPWMIVRTHDYAAESNNHRLHWQKGVFLRHGAHGEAMLEKRGREFHVYAQSIYPEYFMNVLQETLQKLIRDNWPGLEGRYRFTVPCPTFVDGKPCKGRFNIQALRQFISNGVQEYPCQECYKSHSIRKLLSGLEPSPIDVQLREINQRLGGMDSRIAHYFWATMHAIADEAKHGPRLFTFRSRDAGVSPKQLLTRPISLQLWCEAEGCQHPIIEDGKGLYSIDQPHEWVMKIAPYANFALDILKTVAPIAVPAINSFFGPKTTELWGIADHLSLASAIIGKLPAEVKTPDKPMLRRDVVSKSERSGILALHRLLNQLDRNQENLGLHRVATYTGDYRWLCQRHYDAYQPNIPDVITAHE